MCDRLGNYASLGPWGNSLNTVINNTAIRNVPFSSVGWEAAKQNGCTLPPGACLPTWPPQHGFVSTLPCSQNALSQVVGVGTQSTGLNVPFSCEVNQQVPFPNVVPVGTDIGTDIAARLLLNKDTLVQANQTQFISPFANETAGSTLDDTFGNLNLSNTNPTPQIPSNPPIATQEILPSVQSPSTSCNAPVPVPPSPVPNILEKINYDIRDFVPCMQNSMQGIVYDLKHWKHLPASDKWTYVFTRDNRLLYLLIFCSGFILVLLLLRCLLFS